MSADTDVCECGRPLMRDPGDYREFCSGCNTVATFCTCGPLTAKEAKEANKAPPDTPVAGDAVYRGVLGQITAEAAPSTEADPVGIFVSLMAGAGVIAGPAPYVRIGNLRHPLLIWPLLMGRTGSGRKGEATAIADMFLRRAFPEEFHALAVSGLSSGEGLIERIRDDRDSPGDKRLLVTEHEFTSVMARSRREGSTLAAVQREAWDGLPLSVLNRQQLRASASHVAVIGHVTPREFRLRMAETDMAGGTYNRYLPVFVERSRRLPVPEAVPEPAVRHWAGKLAAAIAAASRTGCIQLGAEATQLWAGELYEEFTETDYDDDLAYSEFTRRAAPYCLRIAGLHAALDGRAQIGKDDLAAAGALVRYSITSARYVLGTQGRDPRRDQLTRAITAAGQAGMTRTQVSGLFSRKLAAEVITALLAELVDSGDYEEIQAETGGRPATAYRRVLSLNSLISPVGDPRPEGPS
jgi:hypothetical protein